MSYEERIARCLEPLQGTVYRVVESQEEIATTRLVDNIPEQARLEELLEKTKPAHAKGTRGLHYLLATPFRYPPLKHGSRFGQAFEKSLFYGAMAINTALAETAFYRFVFINHVVTPFPKPLRTLHTVFGARIRTERGVRLQGNAWRELHEELTHPSSYELTQSLGSEMRNFGVTAFQFLSARALQAGLYTLPYDAHDGMEGINAALFEPGALKDRKPREKLRLIVVTGAESVSMSLTREDGSRNVLEFSRSQFLINGSLPDPAI
ncbi:RES family NAD+ phosphorylase [Marinobacter sp. M216]|uniref:RES family NAD+ phosphorylase n=1 Tax=Marinobacter albus TaxID=3030833 RepID=A0ABT7HC99_9GAMM|nr:MULTISPECIES: RES family NAD+ phosphorylase [unclassified Marinobacter]MBW7469756.1 RES family NAD+ phosphorylase [Marinobacter sp. F4218]MDK9557985.1 RES family NAD+ phosphorylase [Marinobacter sp. M216]